MCNPAPFTEERYNPIRDRLLQNQEVILEGLESLMLSPNERSAAITTIEDLLEAYEKYVGVNTITHASAKKTLELLKDGKVR